MTQSKEFDRQPAPGSPFLGSPIGPSFRRIAGANTELNTHDPAIAPTGNGGRDNSRGVAHKRNSAPSTCCGVSRSVNGKNDDLDADFTRQGQSKREKRRLRK
jgi:hypothetical protein